MKQEKEFEVVGVSTLAQDFVEITLKSTEKIPVIEQIPKTEMEKEIAAGAKLMQTIMPTLMPPSMREATFVKGTLPLSKMTYQKLGSPTVGDILLISIQKQEEPQER